MSDLNHTLSSEEIDNLVKGGDWFPFVEVWSTRTSQEMFDSLAASEYGGPVEFIPRISIGFTPADFKFSIPARFRRAIPQLRGTARDSESFAILTHDVDNRDLREMNAVGDFYMEDIRLVSSKRRFQKFTPIEMWDRDKERIVDIARSKSPLHTADPYEIRNAVFSYTKESNPFRPTIALAIYSILNAKSILDMSSGWGDRLIGALAWSQRSKLPVLYRGYDPFCDLQDRYTAMIRELGEEDSETRFSVTCAPFEESPVEENTFDLAFTSPPYFDFEEYGLSATSIAQRSDQSTVKYPEIKFWIEGFLKPMMKKASLSLRRRGHLAINIEGPFMYKVLEDSREFLGPRMEYVGIIGYRSDDPKDRFTHPVFVWRRTA